jgi:serine phosphatase RsbU (regulator of sigma subunit)
MSERGLRAVAAGAEEAQKAALVSRPRTLSVGIPHALVAGAGVVAALEIHAASLPEAQAALVSRACEVILLDGDLPAPALDAFLEAAGETLQPGRPVVLVVASEGRRTNVSAHFVDHVDDFVNGTRGEEGLLARVRNALRARAVVDELQGKNAELSRANERVQGMARRMSEELRLAAQLQRSLLPPPAVHPRIDLAREYLPMREIGGDYFDVIPLGPERVAIALGDVMGKGVSAALLAGTLKAGLRAQLQSGGASPCEAVSRLNRLFWEVTPKGLFASLFFGIVDLEQGSLEYVNAGHDYPFVARADGSVSDLDAGGTVLGLLESARYERSCVPFGREDALVLYTDGVTDRTSPSDEAFGVDRLKSAAQRSRRDQARLALYSILGEVQDWAGAATPQDDMTLVVVRTL